MTEIRERDEGARREITAFADQLLRELLAQRCDPEGLFYLPGLPVTNRELLAALVTDRRSAEASSQLSSEWNRLLLTALRESDLRLSKIVRLYQMDEVWILALVLTLAQRLDPKYEKAIRLLQGDSGRRGVDPSLLRALAGYLGIETVDSLARLFDPGGRGAELFEHGENGELFLRSNVCMWLWGPEDDYAVVKDGIELYPLLRDGCVIRWRETEWVSAVSARHLELGRETALVFELQGRPGAGKKHFARTVAGRLNLRLAVLRLSTLLGLNRQQGMELLNNYLFTCRVNDCLPYFDLWNCAEQEAELLRWLEAAVGGFPLSFIGSVAEQRVTKHLPVATQKLSLDQLSMEDNLALWREMGSRYPVAKDVCYEQLVGKYRLLPAVIAEVFVRAEQRCWEQGMEEIDGAALLSCVRECNRCFDNPLMERIRTEFCWEDLQVKPETLWAMRLACAHLKHRFDAQGYLGSRNPYGCGVSVLMYGPPGTGKTMAAQVMANELQMDLCRVDLSQVSSKYIGETEKNLEKIFREAEQSNVILFFDEADSLFGKRTEVKDSNDKYANQETSYILQRIESYDGMVILATNFARNFDPAFMRRITVSIQFEQPGEQIRKLLWQDMLRNTPLAANEPLIQDLAAQFELSGSHIKSIVRNAVFIALMEDRNLCVADLIAAVKIEFEKMGKIANASNFGTFFNYIL